MANIQKRVLKNKVTWRARYRTPSGEERNKSFDRRVDAERFLVSIESSKNLGLFVDPTKSKLRVGEWAQHWLANQTHLKPSTRERYAGILREHILAEVETGSRLGEVTHSDVQSWVGTALAKKETIPGDPPTSPPGPQSLILDMAVKDGRLVRNVAHGVNLPRIVRGEGDA